LIPFFGFIKKPEAIKIRKISLSIGDGGLEMELEARKGEEGNRAER